MIYRQYSKIFSILYSKFNKYKEGNVKLNLNENSARIAPSKILLFRN